MCPRRHRTTAFLVVILVVLAGCERDIPDAESVYLSITDTTTTTVDDSSFPLKGLSAISFTGASSFVAADQSDQVVVIEGSRVTRRFGTQGEGPCEIQNPWLVEVDGNLVYILDADKSTILKHHLDSGSCIEEFTNQEFRRFNGLASSGDLLFGVMGGIGAQSDSSAAAVYSVDVNGQLSPLNITRGEIPRTKVPAPVRMQAPIKLRDSRLYFSVALGKAVVDADLVSGEYTVMDLPFDTPELAVDASMQSVMTFLNEAELLRDFFVLSDHFVYVSRQPSPGEPGNWYAYFVDKNGSAVLRTDPIDGQIVNVTDSEIVAIRIDESATTTPFRLVRYSYQIGS